jgi:choline dehydrogenase-like flavoprotein
VLCELLLAAGAEAVFPGVAGVPTALTDRAASRRLADDGPTDARAFAIATTHLFGTCRMASSPERGVVRPDLRQHAIDRLWVVDSSVFPSNTGVNPRRASSIAPPPAASCVREAGRR